MPRLLLKFSRDDLRGADPIPAGIYDAMVDTSGASVEVSSNGTPYVTIAFIIQGGEYNGRKISQRYYLSEKAQKIFNGVLDKLGLAPEADGEFAFDTDAMHGKFCRIRVAKKTSENGNDFNEVTAVMPQKNGEAESSTSRRKVMGF